jgi:cytochrome c-type biogenesis protein CcmF
VDDEEGPPGGEIQLARGDSTVLGEDQYALAFERFAVLQSGPGMPAPASDVPQRVRDQVPDDAQMAVAAVLRATNLETGEQRTLRPVYLVMQDRSVQYIENRVGEWGLKVAFTKMDVNTGNINLAVEGVDVMPEDWVVVQAYAKPFISLVWVGIILMTGGFVVSIVRRARDVQFDAQRSA